MIRNKARWLLAALPWVAALWPAPAQSQSAALMNTYNQFDELYAQGRYEEAFPSAERALKLSEKEFGPDHPITANFLNNLASLYHATGRYAEAELLHERSLATREKTLGPEHPDVAASLDNLGSLYQAQGHYTE